MRKIRLVVIATDEAYALMKNNAANIPYIENFGLIENVADAFLKKFALDNCLREHLGAG